MYAKEMSLNKKVTFIFNFLMTNSHSFKLDYEDCFATFIIEFNEALYSSLKIFSLVVNFTIFKTDDEIEIDIYNENN